MYTGLPILQYITPITAIYVRIDGIISVHLNPLTDSWTRSPYIAVIEISFDSGASVSGFGDDRPIRW